MLKRRVYIYKADVYKQGEIIMDTRPALGKVEDLAALAKLDDHVLLQELKARYQNNDIYVSLHQCNCQYRYNNVS